LLDYQWYKGWVLAVEFFGMELAFEEGVRFFEGKLGAVGLVSHLGGVG
jgi:hypothetical protein